MTTRPLADTERLRCVRGRHRADCKGAKDRRHVQPVRQRCTTRGHVQRCKGPSDPRHVRPSRSEAARLREAARKAARRAARKGAKAVVVDGPKCAQSTMAAPERKRRCCALMAPKPTPIERATRRLSAYRASCRACRQTHIDWERPEGTGYCHGYRQRWEHYHPTYGAMMACAVAA